MFFVFAFVFVRLCDENVTIGLKTIKKQVIILTKNACICHMTIEKESMGVGYFSKWILNRHMSHKMRAKYRESQRKILKTFSWNPTCL